MTGVRAARARRAFPWFVVGALLTVSLTMRAPLLAITPVLRDIEESLGVDSTTVSLLTTAPVVMFAAVTPLAALVIRRAGTEIALLGCLLAVVVGTLLRALPGFGWMLTGMLVIGAGLAVGNVVVPVLIRRDVPSRHVATVTAWYTAVINVGSLLVTLGTAPIAQATGWSLAILSWLWVTLLGLALWILHMWRRGRTAADRPDAIDADAPAHVAGDELLLTGPVPAIGATTRRSFLRDPVVWLLVATFSCQSSGFYAISTWLPTLLADTTGSDPSGAGAIAAIFQGTAILGALVVPLLARSAPMIVPAAVVSACWILISAGLLFAPDLYLLWVSIGGIAQGGGFVAVLTVLVKYARNDAEAATGSALVQGCGYVVAALGAPVMGAVHQISGGWSAPLGVTLGLAIGFTVCLLSAIVFARRAG